MQDLNRQQIILLCVLISFVVSIATGIMTTSLLMEAPIELTQTVNRVVERTVETVVPGAISQISNTGKTQTIVITEDDSITKSVSKNEASIVRIRAVSADESINNFYAMGFVITSDGIIVSDSQFISTVMNYVAVMNDKTEIPLVVVPLVKGSNLQFFKAKPIKPYSFTPAKINTTDVKLGQTLIGIGGNTSNAVIVGRAVSLVVKDQVNASSTVKYISSIQTDINSSDIISGSLILNLSGDVVGMQLSDFSSTKIFFPGSLITSEIGKLQIVKQ